MSKYSPRYGRSDHNQKELVEYMRSLGASVVHTTNVHKGMTDLVVGINGKNYLVEVKSSKGKLTKDQVHFFDHWKGQICVIRNKEDADKLLNKGL